ncbi:PREDICTED: uncharacterized protein LOC107342210 [Acropora digitifera]|uniref:uncharacterized protein LOC107342210 n=1 Tax=Acropora digitifera TaxID=70779 RepID=UPI00077A6B2C|nr:PREDICTED: uncharacterized protein LOC107342210 [Acropora digitifera]
MMPRLTSHLKSTEESFDVTLSGGSPWGFMLDGGSDFRRKLIVSKITRGGKADLLQSIAVGDEVLAINGIPCVSRAEAMELVRCSRQKLKISLRRDGNNGPVKQYNGPSITTSSDPVPNFYETAVEHYSNPDFFSTYNVDRNKFAQMTRSKNIFVSTDNLSSSIDDLLESCRQGSEKQLNAGNSVIMVEANGRFLEKIPGLNLFIRHSKPVKNKKQSSHMQFSEPPTVDLVSTGILNFLIHTLLKPEQNYFSLRRINSLNSMTGKKSYINSGQLGVGQRSSPGTDIYGPTWSLRRGISLPEGSWPVSRQRTSTSPGRIQKVTVKSSFAVSPQKGSPPGRETEKQQTTRNSLPRDDWVGRWLLAEPQRVTPLNAGTTHYKDRSKDKDKESINRNQGSVREKPDVRNSQTLPSSKSYGGGASYGVTVTATAVKRNEGGISNTVPFSRGANRYSSSNLIHERGNRPNLNTEVRSDELPSRQPQGPWNSQVYAQPGDKVEVRLPRDMAAPKRTTSESTSSNDSVGTTDPSVGGVRKQCPAPPPRRSTSLLLSSFRTQGRRQIPQEIPPKFGSVSRLSEGAMSPPVHSPSRSWPTEKVVEDKPAGSEITRQSWHAEPAVMTGYERRTANSSISSTSSDMTPDRRLSKTNSVRVKSSVVIRSMRSSSSSSMDESSSPMVYRSGQVSPEGDVNRAKTLPLRKKLSSSNEPMKLPSDGGQWKSQNKRD